MNNVTLTASVIVLKVAQHTLPKSSLTCLTKIAESGWIGKDSCSCFMSRRMAFTFGDLYTRIHTYIHTQLDNHCTRLETQLTEHQRMLDSSHRRCAQLLVAHSHTCWAPLHTHRGPSGSPCWHVWPWPMTATWCPLEPPLGHTPAAPPLMHVEWPSPVKGVVNMAHPYTPFPICI